MWERIQHADARIADARAAERERSKLERDHATVGARLKDVDERIGVLQDEVDEELQDVERLEGGWYALLRQALGDRDDRLDEERREHAAAALRLDAARSEARDLAQRLADLERRLAAVGDPTAALAAARRDKAQLLHDLDDPRAHRLTTIAEELGEITADERELVEAVEAAEIAAGWLRDADTMLSKAADWGTWDLMGGGMVSSLAKQGRMQDARSSLHHAAAALRALDTELADVATDVRDAPHLDTRGMTGMLDVFFDNIITDWTVQGRIRDARTHVHAVGHHVAEIAVQLRHVARDLDQRRARLWEQRASLLDAPG